MKRKGHFPIHFSCSCDLGKDHGKDDLSICKTGSTYYDSGLKSPWERILLGDTTNDKARCVPSDLPIVQPSIIEMNAHQWCRFKTRQPGGKRIVERRRRTTLPLLKIQRNRMVNASSRDPSSSYWIFFRSSSVSRILTYTNSHSCPYLSLKFSEGLDDVSRKSSTSVITFATKT
ncbi:hypothetical protein VNO77_03317 [Canavalia gladiata]|uniref:Uncharacterized protein n=1 Tax=Canavalia gladiata TaxID=3824 RepID=A0AAN9N0Y1_CANGL